VGRKVGKKYLIHGQSANTCHYGLTLSTTQVLSSEGG